MRESLSLLELNIMVRDAIDASLPDLFWVEAEIAEIRENRGHCYVELVQKDERGNTPVAKASAKCWRNTWALVRNNFERITGQGMAAGMKVLLQVYAQFHESYGFSWIIADADPVYTMGDMARRRRDIIEKLKEYGVLNLNKELAMPLFAQHIAVVSSATAAGYGDFCNQLSENPYGFNFHTRLFPAVMQGEKVEESVISALDAINAEAQDFDCVVIIRGGGAASDLSGFDTLALAENVANFPLPVITGIGHERDETVLDMVAHTALKTPTAVAAYFIDNLKQVADALAAAERFAADSSRRVLTSAAAYVDKLSLRLPVMARMGCSLRQAALQMLTEKINSAAGMAIRNGQHRLAAATVGIESSVLRHRQSMTHRLDMLAQRVKASDPYSLMTKGYSLTLHNGKAVRSVEQLNEGDEIVTMLADGRLKSRIEQKSQ